jgi:hypothetical protein
MRGNQPASVYLPAALAAMALLVGACSQPARPDRMATEVVSVPDRSEPPAIANLFVTVYGDSVGGFASHYYPLPREDYEAALLETLAANTDFAASPTPEDADYDVNVGLISLVAPKWSGTVTLETTWSITAPNRGEEIARQMIRSEAPSPFGKVRDATEEAARKSIDSGLAWLLSELGPAATEE